MRMGEKLDNSLFRRFNESEPAKYCISSDCTGCSPNCK